MSTDSVSEKQSIPHEEEDSASASKLAFEDVLSDEEKDTKTNELAAQYNVNQRKLMWKLDICIVPPFLVLYFLAFLDRINISNAAVYGMSKDLHLHGNQFNTALVVFFAPYIFFEVVSNWLMKKVPPHIWLSGCIFCFGIVTLGLGFVKTFGGLVGCRFTLGLLESATFPGIFYVLSTYYTSAEAQRRFSFFFSGTCLSGAAGGAIAFKIKELDGKHGIAAWSWIFIIEGAFTAGLAIFLYFTVPDFPEEARFLNANEKKFIQEKLEIHSVSSGFHVNFNWRDMLKQFFSDPLFILAALAYFALIIPSYGYAYFSPSIIKAMGYTAQSANAHSVYPWVCAFGLINILAFISDYKKIRFPFAIGSALLAIVGLAMVLAIHGNEKARYAGCFLTACGLYSSMPSLVCWVSLNYGGHLRKSLGTSFLIGFGNIGGIISVFLFLSKDAPHYTKGLSVCIAFTALAVVLLAVLAFFYKRRNDQKQTEEYKQKFYSQPEREIILQGDLNPVFKYLY